MLAVRRAAAAMGGSVMPKRPFEMDTTWDGIGWTGYGNGAVTSMFVVGDPSDPDAPTVFRG